MILKYLTIGTVWGLTNLNKKEAASSSSTKTPSWGQQPIGGCCHSLRAQPHAGDPTGGTAKRSHAPHGPQVACTSSFVGGLAREQVISISAVHCSACQGAMDSRRERNVHQLPVSLSSGLVSTGLTQSNKPDCDSKKEKKSAEEMVPFSTGRDRPVICIKSSLLFVLKNRNSEGYKR